MTLSKTLVLSATAVSLSTGAVAQDRMPPIPADKMTEAQKKAASELASGPRGSVFGPFIPLLRSPEFMSRLQKMGEYLRYKSALPARLSEFTILVTARRFTQQYEWYVHHPIALKAGVKSEVAAAIAEGRRPTGMTAEEEVVYDFCDELFRTDGVSDATYARAVAKLGEQGVIDLLGIAGYYTMLAMVMNVARTPLPEGKPSPLGAFPR